MFQSQKLTLGEETDVGIGWRGSWDLAGRQVVEHAGAMGGARSVISIYPEENLVIAFMTNAMTPSRIEEMAHVLALPFLTEGSAKKQPRGEAEVTYTENKSGGGGKQPKGTLFLDGVNDRLIIDGENSKSTTYRLIYLQKDNLYGMVTDDGIRFANLEVDERTKKVLGKAVSYGSPQPVPPAFENAAIVFEGNFMGKKR